MKLFIDANVIVAVLNKEYPLFTHASRILSLADNSRFTLFTSPVCLAIAFYFAEKKYKSAVAKQKIEILCDHIKVAAVNTTSVMQSLKNRSVHDFEDGLEYYTAIENKCDCIITEDVGDFYFSKIDVLTCEGFFEKYLLKAAKRRKNDTKL